MISGINPTANTYIGINQIFSEDGKDFNERLEYLLKAHSMTARELTEKLNIGRTTVNDWKRGKSTPSPKILIGISQIFGVRLDWLLTGEGDIHISEYPEKPPTPQKGEIVLMAKAYGGKTEIITMSEEDFELSKPLLERMRHEYEEEHGTQKKRRKRKKDMDIW